MIKTLSPDCPCQICKKYFTIYTYLLRIAKAFYV